MKKLFILLCLIFLTLPVFAGCKNTNTEYFNLFPKEEISDYIKQIPLEQQSQYKKDMEKELRHILYDKIVSMPNSNHKKTFRQLLIDMEKEADFLYQEYLSGKIEDKYLRKYIKIFDEFLGILSLYPQAIIEELSQIIKKYELTSIGLSSTSDIILYQYYLKDYKIKYANKFCDLILLKQQVFDKIFKYKLIIDPHFNYGI